MNITILDFSTATVYIKQVPESIQELQSDEIMEHFATELNIREKDCQYMIIEENNFESDFDITANQ